MNKKRLCQKIKEPERREVRKKPLMHTNTYRLPVSPAIRIKPSFDTASFIFDSQNNLPINISKESILFIVRTRRKEQTCWRNG